MKRKLVIVEKTLIRIGALLGVVATGILLYSEVLKPSPPNIDVAFLLSNSDTINYAQQVSDPEESHTEAFPVGLVVHNNGGTIAKDVVLSFIADKAEIFTFQGLRVEKSYLLVDGTGFRPLYRIHLGSVNPGEMLCLAENVWCQTVNIHKFTSVKAVKNSGEKHEIPLSELWIAHDFEIRLSAANAGMKTRHLYLNTGIQTRFRDNKKPHYTYKGGAITFHKGDS